MHALTPRSFTPYTRRLSASPAPRKVPLLMSNAAQASGGQDVHLLRMSLDQMKAEQSAAQDRLEKRLGEHEQRMSSLSSLQIQVDSLVGSLGNLTQVQMQMKKDLTATMSQVKLRNEQPTSAREEVQESLAKAHEEIQEALRRCEETLEASARRSVNDAIAQNLVQEHMQRLDVQVRELSESFKPMIDRIAKLTTQCEESQAEAPRRLETSEAPMSSEASSQTRTPRSEPPAEADEPRAEQVVQDGPPVERRETRLQVPLQRRSSAPSLVAVHMPHASPRAMGSGLARPLPGANLVPRRSPAPSPALIWGGTARHRSFMPESGSILTVGPPRGPTLQEASRMSPEDQEATRLEAMRVAVATARPPPHVPMDEGKRIAI